MCINERFLKFINIDWEVSSFSKMVLVLIQFFLLISKKKHLYFDIYSIKPLKNKISIHINKKYFYNIFQSDI